MIIETDIKFLQDDLTKFVIDSLDDVEKVYRDKFDVLYDLLVDTSLLIKPLISDEILDDDIIDEYMGSICYELDFYARKLDDYLLINHFQDNFLDPMLEDFLNRSIALELYETSSNLLKLIRLLEF